MNNTFARIDLGVVHNEEQNIIRELLESMIVKYEARRWDKATRAK